MWHNKNRFMKLFISVICGIFASVVILSVSVMARNNTRQAITACKSSDIKQYLKKQWYLEASDIDRAWMLADEKAAQAKAAYTAGTTDAQVKIALVDSGVDANHPDLNGKIITELGYNFVDHTKNTTDVLGHGTQLAGIIAANGTAGNGVIGIAGKYNIGIIPVKVLDKYGNGSADIVAEGIVYSADVGADIINVSIDFKLHDSQITKALAYAKKKGALVIVAAGNSNSNCNAYSPAGDFGAFTVAAVGKDRIRSSFSSYGTSIKVAAPGEDILTTTLNGGYEITSGTSMAAPIVSGLAALLKLQRPELGSTAIQHIITATAVDAMEKGRDKYTGFGIIDAYQAMKLAMSYDIHAASSTGTNLWLTGILSAR